MQGSTHLTLHFNQVTGGYAYAIFKLAFLGCRGVLDTACRYINEVV